MYLSRVTLDLDDRLARRDVADPYEMHATLMRLVDAGAGRPLWRLESGRGTVAPQVLVQTDAEPDANALRERGSDYFTEFDTKRHALCEAIAAGDVLRFRVRANPTVKRERKRHGLTNEEDQLAWIERTLLKHGAASVVAIVRGSERRSMGRRRSGPPIVIQDVTFEGMVRVADPDAMRSAIRQGVGHARALGYGLLSVAR